MDADQRKMLELCAQGDPAACAQLVELHGRMAGTLIRRIIGRREDVEDLLQETFLRVFRYLKEFEGRAKLSTWICTIAQRVATDELRRRQRRVPVVTEEAGQTAAADVNVELEASQEQIDRHVREALATLPDRYRLPIIYATIDGLDYDTIGSLLSIPVGTVKTHVFRGKQMLREKLEKRLDVRNTQT